MKNTIAFAGSNSSKSINHQIVSFVASLTEQTNVLKLTDFEAPIYSSDIEEESGIPKGIVALNEQISSADRLIISVSEHNGNLSAFFKNTIDWLSRNDRDFLKGKEVILLSCSPGPGGASSALAIAEKTLPYFGATIKSKLSIGNFYQIFENGKINDANTIEEIKKCLA